MKMMIIKLMLMQCRVEMKMMMTMMIITKLMLMQYRVDVMRAGAVSSPDAPTPPHRHNCI